jgi:nucleotide-binding universal stress UspA family protein
MKILATFDGTTFSESTVPLLQRMAGLPEAEFILLSIAHEPDARRQRGARRTVIGGEILGSAPILVEQPQAGYAETKDQAIERRRVELERYLVGLAAKFPPGSNVSIEAHIDNHPAQTIIDRAREDAVAVIVMATHSRSPVGQMLFGSTTESVVRSGVAPVLLVHPTP